MKNVTNCLFLLIGVSFFLGEVKAQTSFTPTTQKFKNGEFVWSVNSNGARVGEFWPIHGLNLVTNDTDPSAFGGADIATTQKNLGGVATAPDGMTGGSIGNYQMQGRSLSHGRPCGDGFEYNYGIVMVSGNGYAIKFTHRSEIGNFDSTYAAMQKSKSTMFFLPSIYRNGACLVSEKTVDKVLIRRITPTGEQIGVIVFDKLVTYNQARTIVLGLDRAGKSSTTHIYVLDGGPTWGQACKEVNGNTIEIGTRNASVVTNYLVFY